MDLPQIVYVLSRVKRLDLVIPILNTIWWYITVGGGGGG